MANRLLLILIGVSLAIHLVLFLQIAGIYDSRRLLSYIELTLRDESRLAPRSIPRPRPRHETPRVHEARPHEVRQTQTPRIVDDMVPDTSSLMPSFDAPDVSALQGAHAAGWAPPGFGDYVSRDDYFETIRMRIESRKEYPPEARRKHMEGRVTVRFTVLPDGNITSLKVAGDPRALLKTAALEAVNAAAPFPRPPANLFKGPLHVEIALLFELMPGAGRF